MMLTSPETRWIPAAYQRGFRVRVSWIPAAYPGGRVSSRVLNRMMGLGSRAWVNRGVNDGFTLGTESIANPNPNPDPDPNSVWPE